MNRITQFLPSDELFHADEQPTPDSFTFTSLRFDSFAALQWNMPRHFDPGLGQWMSEDPIGFEGDPSNQRRYVENQPTSFVDPQGLDLAEVFSSPHAGIEVDLWDDDDNRIGKLTVDYGARGWRNGQGSSGESSDSSSGSSSSSCNSSGSQSSWSGGFNSGQFIIGISPDPVQQADSGRVYYLRGTQAEDRRALQYIATSVGLTPNQLVSRVQQGQTSFDGSGRWYAYFVIGNSCRSFANRVFNRYNGERVTE